MAEMDGDGGMYPKREMRKGMYKCGIIGCGFIGIQAPDSHLRAYLDCAGTELVVLCDTDYSKYYENEAIPDVPFWYDYLEMVRSEKLDIVSVCTPPATHCQIVCDIAPYVKAIYCEKPIAITPEEADKMIETCHQHNVILQVNHQRRFMPVKVRFSRGIENTGTHMFDRLRQLFGEYRAYEAIGNDFPGRFLFGNQWIEIEYIEGDEHIFEIDCTRNSERMILRGVEHLVWCLGEGRQSISSGEQARKTLETVLAFKEVYEGNK